MASDCVRLHLCLGVRLHVFIDHKPLVPPMSTTSLDSLPPRVLRFRLRLMRFSYSICHVAGKYLYTADTLSRAPVSHPEAADVLEDHLTECFVNNVLASLPASPDTLHCYQTAQ